MEAEIKNVQKGCIPLSEATLPQVKVGMFWYDDDTVSETLVSGKVVKSVVLAIDGKIIYGDMFIEKVKPIAKVKKFVHSCKNDFVQQGNAHVQTEREMALMLPFMENINAVLASLHKPIWTGIYLTSTEYACYNHWVYNMPVGIKHSNYQSNTKVRPVFRYDVLK